MTNNLEDSERLRIIREEIDQYDKAIVEIFEQRMDRSLAVLKIKQKNGLAILQGQREKVILDKIRGYLKNKNLELELEELYLTIMKLSRQVQAREWELTDLLPIGDGIVLPLGKRTNAKKVAFQGEPGAFSHQAAKAYFGQVENMRHYPTFEDVFIAVDKGEIDYGVLPMENSSTGGVFEIYDLLLKYDLYIVGDITLNIEQHLIAVNGASIETIEEVYSHPQGLSQCKEFLKQNPHWKQIATENTATSAKYIKNIHSLTKAAIASKEAANLYELKIVKENIHSIKENKTRFIVIGKKVEVLDNSKRISLVYSLRHNVGSLYDSLGIFVEQGINLEKVESRPIPNQPWKYHFFVDIAGNLLDTKVHEALKNIHKSSLNLKILGNY